VIDMRFHKKITNSTDAGNITLTPRWSTAYVALSSISLT